MKEKLLLEMKRQAVIFGAQEAGEVHYNGHGHNGCKEDAVYGLTNIYQRVTGENEFDAILRAFYKGKELAKKGYTRESRTRNWNTAMKEVNEYLETMKG